MKTAWRWPLLAAAISMAAALALPSRDVHGDAFDELLSVESATCPSSPKHPAAEPVAWLLMRGLARLGYSGRAIRPIQLWNGVWMSLALAALTLWAGRAGRGRAMTAAAVLLVAGSYSWVHLVLDPYLFYWPPALAGVLWAASFSQEAGHHPRRSWVLALLCLTGALLFNPLVVFAVPAVALSNLISDTGPRWPARWRGLALIIVPAGLLWLALGHAASLGVGELYGRWRADTWSSTLRGAEHALLPHSFHLDGRSWQAVGARLATVARWLLVPSGAAMLVLSVWLRPRRCYTGTAFLGGALTSAVLVAWWDPAQGQFWLLPVLLLVMGVTATQAGAPAARLARASRVVLCAQGALFLLVSTVGYAVPAATAACDRAAVALRTAAHFEPTDVLIYSGFSDPYLAYYAGRPGRCLITFYFQQREHPELHSTRGALDHFIQQSALAGHRVFLQTSSDGLPEVPDWVVAAGVDYRKEDFQRVRWGPTVEAEGQTFRQALGVER